MSNQEAAKQLFFNTELWEEISDTQGEAISAGNLGQLVSQQGPSQELIATTVVTNVVTTILTKNKEAAADPTRLYAILNELLP